jgi:GH15 family glucan-1,4-alpha-glucosidase
MPHTLFLAPSGSSVGLTSVALGLLRALDSRGVRVAFFKPIGQFYGKASGTERSTHFVRQTTALADIIDWLCENWDQPDEGVWETRGGRKNFTYGRFQAWVALDRAIRLAQNRGRPADLARWITQRDAIYRQVMERGWNPKVGAFTQHYDTEVLDSSLLKMPMEGFIAPRDPMWLSTLAAMDRELVSDSLVYRYNPSASPDGLAGDEGTFSLCTFWYVDALARAGRLDDARLTFEKMHTYANHLGLFSEEIGSTGEQLGNFPQAFSHLSLISAAVNLDRQLDQGS